MTGTKSPDILVTVSIKPENLEASGPMRTATVPAISASVMIFPGLRSPVARLEIILSVAEMPALHESSTRLMCPDGSMQLVGLE